jgi:hypothetical protein
VHDLGHAAQPAVAADVTLAYARVHAAERQDRSQPVSSAESPHRTAAIYKRSDGFLVHPLNRATTGLGLASEPVWRLPSASSASDLGAAVLSALGTWRDGVPHPTVWKGYGKTFLKAAGFRSWRSLEAGADHCIFSDDGTVLTFLCCKPCERGGFVPSGRPSEVVLSMAPSDVVGAAALRALGVAP